MTTSPLISRWSAYALSTDADCGGPDDLDSPGARFLLQVQDDLLERVPDEDVLQLQRDSAGYADTDHWSDVVAELADAAVPIYTHEKWLAFVDLQGYNEDISDYLGGSSVDSLDQIASLALYGIAERLAFALLSQRLDAAQEIVADEEEEEEEDEVDSAEDSHLDDLGD